VRENAVQPIDEQVSFAEPLLHLLGIASRWHLQAPALLVALLMPVCLLALADWRMKARR
jgi:hypothetical protein